MILNDERLAALFNARGKNREFIGFPGEVNVSLAEPYPCCSQLCRALASCCARSEGTEERLHTIIGMQRNDTNIRRQMLFVFLPAILFLAAFLLERHCWTALRRFPLYSLSHMLGCLFFLFVCWFLVRQYCTSGLKCLLPSLSPSLCITFPLLQREVIDYNPRHTLGLLQKEEKK